jgi:predicted dienelactone hydrolase
MPASTYLLIATAVAATFLVGCASRPSAEDEAARQAALARAQQLHAALRTDQSRFMSVALDWVDASRGRAVPARLYLPTPLNGTPSGSPQARVPLVVFSHGIGGSREGYKYLGQHFAANGFATLHVQHVGSDRQLWFGNPITLLGRLNAAATDDEAISPVADVRFALDQLLASDWATRLDPTRIAAAGHSYGANTTLLLAGAAVSRDEQARYASAEAKTDAKLAGLKDSRIRAAIVLSAPPFYGMRDLDGILNHIDMPTLHITATGDDIEIPGYKSGIADRLAVFDAIGRGTGAPKALAVFKDGSHSIFTDRAMTGGLELNPKVKAATRDLALVFLEKTLGGATRDLSHWRTQHADLVAQFEVR